MTWTTFGSATSASTGDLDNNLNYAVAMGVIPCAVTGTNTLTLTPVAARTPSVTSYANHMTFGGIITNTNSGAVTLQVGTLPALAVYSDTSTGPVVLVGGELAAGNFAMFVYDSALNSGAGGFHVRSNSWLALSGGTVTGNLTVTGNVSLGTLSSLHIDGGATITNILTTTSSLSFAIAGNSYVDNTITLTGVSVGDVVGIGLPASIAPATAFNARVATADHVVLRGVNAGSTSQTTAGVFRVQVNRVTP